MNERQHFMARLIGTRPTWPHDMSDAEGAVMAEHFRYLSNLLEEGRVLLAGPSFEAPPVGLVLLATDDEAEARALMLADPSVVAELHTLELSAIQLALWAGKEASAS